MNSKQEKETSRPEGNLFGLNWGHRIALAYIGFVLFMIGLVVMAFQQKFDLVADDYYAQEIAYQGRIDQMDNAKAKNYTLTVEQSSDEVTLRFPTASTGVRVQFFRPSDETMDIHRTSEESVMELIFLRSDLSSGKYLVKAEWQADGKVYYEEKAIVIN
ncbi:MAG: FixH family protein [Flavobacteriales bacterium]|nr:FixH family protein [Flavobacteriales bacterium]